MANEKFIHQVVLSNVPRKDGSHSTLTFYKENDEPELRYYDLFEYMETETGIPRFYFTLKNNRTTIRFTDLFSQRQLYKLSFTPKAPLDMFNVNVDIHATQKLFDIHKTILKNIKRDATKMYALNSMLDFVKKYIYRSPIMVEYCMYFTKFPEFISSMSQEDKFKIVNGVDMVVRMYHEETNYIYDEDVDQHTFHTTRKRIEDLERKRGAIIRTYSTITTSP